MEIIHGKYDLLLRRKYSWKKLTQQTWPDLREKRGQIWGRESLGDCDNICEGNLVFRVIFGKFMHRWFQICAQLGSCNVFFSHHRPPKLKYWFFRGSFARLTSQSQAGTLSSPFPNLPLSHHGGACRECLCLYDRAARANGLIRRVVEAAPKHACIDPPRDIARYRRSWWYGI